MDKVKSRSFSIVSLIVIDFSICIMQYVHTHACIYLHYYHFTHAKHFIFGCVLVICIRKLSRQIMKTIALAFHRDLRLFRCPFRQTFSTLWNIAVFEMLCWTCWNCHLRGMELVLDMEPNSDACQKRGAFLWFEPEIMEDISLQALDCSAQDVDILAEPEFICVCWPTFH